MAKCYFIMAAESEITYYIKWKKGACPSVSAGTYGKEQRAGKGKSCITSPLGLNSATGDGSNREGGGFIGFMGKQSHWQM